MWSSPTDRSPRATKHPLANNSHTPLSADEYIPWNCKQLIIGKGAHGLLPVMQQVSDRARELGVELVIVATPDACGLLSQADPAATNAILHLTC
jgi:hypothetical protein